MLNEKIMQAKAAKKESKNRQNAPILPATVTVDSKGTLTIVVPEYAAKAEPLTYTTKDGKERTIPATAEVTLPAVTIDGQTFAVTFGGKFGKSSINLS